MPEFKVLRPKIFIKGEEGWKEKFAKIKVEFELEVFLGELDDQEERENDPLKISSVTSINDVERGLERMELTQLGEELLDAIDLSNTITND